MIQHHLFQNSKKFQSYDGYPEKKSPHPVQWSPPWPDSPGKKDLLSLTITDGCKIPVLNPMHGRFPLISLPLSYPLRSIPKFLYKDNALWLQCLRRSSVPDAYAPWARLPVSERPLIGHLCHFFFIQINSTVADRGKLSGDAFKNSGFSGTVRTDVGWGISPFFSWILISW